MRYAIFFIFILALSFGYKIHALEEKDLDYNLSGQVFDYNPKLADSYFCWKIPEESFLEFLEIYKDRPIKYNPFGMRCHGNFFLWYILKKINPSLVIESGVYQGLSTWTIERAAPNAKIIAIDPDFSPRIYHSTRASYITEDFANLKIDIVQAGPIVCFFDDHQNAFDRVMQSHAKGIKYLIFDDNYSACEPHEEYSLTLSMCFEMEKYKDLGEILKKYIKRYYIMPQIIGKTSNHPVCDKIRKNLPAIWNELDDVDPSMREKMKIFSDETQEYRWITYVELY